MSDRVCDILKGSGPPATPVSEAAIFDIPGGDPFTGKGRTEMSGVAQIVPGAPEPAVDEDDQGMRPWPIREPEVAKLERAGAILQA